MAAPSMAAPTFGLGVSRGSGVFFGRRLQRLSPCDSQKKVSTRNEVRGLEISDFMDSRMSSGSVANHTGPRILECQLEHCDSAQRATTCQPGATPQVLSIAMRFALKGLHKTVLWNPFRVRVRMVREPGAAFIRIRGFSCPRLICASPSGSITASIKYNSFVVRGRPCTSFHAEPKKDSRPFHSSSCDCPLSPAIDFPT